MCENVNSTQEISYIKIPTSLLSEKQQVSFSFDFPTSVFEMPLGSLSFSWENIDLRY